MSAKRLYFLLVGVIVLLALGLIGGAYGINSVLQNQSHKLATLKANINALNKQQDGLVQDKHDIEKYASLSQIAKSIVPQDKNQAEALREINSIASSNQIALGSITFPQSDLKANATGKAPTDAQLRLSQLTAVKGITGVYDLQITVASDTNNPVTYHQLINFLEQLENNRRTAQVSSIAINPDAKDSNLLTFTLIINEYIKP